MYGPASAFVTRLIRTQVALAGAAFCAALITCTTPALANGPCGQDSYQDAACPVNGTSATEQGSITTQTETDYYVLHASAGTQLSLSITDEESANCSTTRPSADECGDVQVQLYNANNAYEAGTAGSSPNGVNDIPATTSTTIAAAGTYYLMVSGNLGQQDGNLTTVPYSLQITASPGVVWPGPGWTVSSVPDRGGAAGLNAVSCESMIACVAVGGTQPGFGPKITRTLTEVWNDESWTQSTTTLGSLSGVSCWAYDGCIAVGSTDNNQPLTQAWNGTSWKTLKSPAIHPSGDLDGISCWARNGCLAVGSASSALAEVWNGREWRILSTAPVTRSYLAGVSCWSSSGCVAVGRSYDLDHLGGVTEIWNGRSWKVQQTPNYGNWMTFSVSCWSSHGCMAAGSAYGGGGGDALAEIWNGRSWKRLATAQPHDPELNGVSCAASTNCIAVGQTYPHYEPIVEVWNGHSWAVSPSPNPPDAGILYGASCWSITGCTVVGVHDLGFDSNKPLAESLVSGLAPSMATTVTSTTTKSETGT